MQHEEMADKYFCTVCATAIVGRSEKAIKQHNKSRPHKINLERGSSVTPASAVEESNGGNEEREECALCNLLGRDAEQYCHRPEDMTELNRYCHAPMWMASPKRGLLVKGDTTTPFLTASVGEIPETPSCFLHCSELYCNAGGIRLPNIDISGKRAQVHSLSHAKRILQDANRTVWAAFAVSGEASIQLHPRFLFHLPKHTRHYGVLTERESTLLFIRSSYYEGPGRY